jgi:hypothetical protein
MDAAALGGLFIIVLAAAVIAGGVALVVSGIRRRAARPQSARNRIIFGAVLAAIGVLLLCG